LATVAAGGEGRPEAQEARSMLIVALKGRLQAERKRFQRCRLTTPVEWESFESLPEAQTADLTLELAGDVSTSAGVGPTAVWAQIPCDEELDVELQRALAEAYGFVVGYSGLMHDVCRRIRAVAHPMARLLGMRALVSGQTGVGKELVARAIHRLGPATNAPFVAINCAAIPPGLAASELFGHARGAFTGALQNRQGALALAGNGVLFLDEIGDMPLDVQSQLLRALEERSFVPLGGSAAVELRAQIISATHRPLSDLVERGEFRADLFFRLAQVNITLPALEERRVDIDLLASHFWSAAGGTGPIDPEVLAALRSRGWPGNLRELRSVVERVALWRQAGLGSKTDEIRALVGEAPTIPEPNRTVRTTLSEGHATFERDLLSAVLRRSEWNTEKAARELGVSRRTIYNLLRRHKLKNPSSQ
jgi:DNA-binding NtrC family response regulator